MTNKTNSAGPWILPRLQGGPSWIRKPGRGLQGGRMRAGWRWQLQLSAGVEMACTDRTTGEAKVTGNARRKPEGGSVPFKSLLHTVL